MESSHHQQDVAVVVHHVHLLSHRHWHSVGSAGGEFFVADAYAARGFHVVDLLNHDALLILVGDEFLACLAHALLLVLVHGVGLDEYGEDEGHRHCSYHLIEQVAVENGD